MGKILKQAEAFAYRLASDSSSRLASANSFCDFMQWCIDNHRDITEDALRHYSQVSDLSLEDQVNITRFLQGEVFPD